MKYRLVCIITALTACLGLKAQALRLLHHYDDLNSNLEGHVTQILQDRNGFLWLATWNGLYRFDGYEFCRQKALADSSCTMTSDRIRDAWLSVKGDIFCRTDDGYFRFDMRDYRFYNVDTETEKAEANKALENTVMRTEKLDTMMEYVDSHGLHWQVIHDALYCKMRTESPVEELPTAVPEQVACIKADLSGRVWITSKGNGSVRLLDSNGHSLGYLTPTGTLTSNYVSFGHLVYSFCQTSDGHIWLGTKPDGLFRLTETTPGHFLIEHVEGLTSGAVYSIVEDKRHRLWVGMLGQGIACVENLSAARPTVTSLIASMPTPLTCRVRYIHLTPDNILLATTNDGILVSQLKDDISQMTFRRHAREPMRSSSLTCNATMDIIETPDNRIFISTETDGICEITTDNLLADSLIFRRYNADSGLLPSDIIQSMAQAQGEHLFVVCNRQVVLLDIHQYTYENLGHLFFRYPYKFSEARPLLLADGRWIIGTHQKPIFLPQSLAHRSDFQPPLLLTGISVENRPKELAVENLDTLLLKPSERNITVHFAALDYTDPEAIKYQFRLGNDTTAWTNIGYDHSVTLLDLNPGTYQLAIRSTNADGQWTDNVRKLTIVVEPTFWETPWAVLLCILLGLGVVAAILTTILYIRHIKHRQQEALDKYLHLLEEHRQEAHLTNQKPTDNDSTTDESTVDPIVNAVILFVEQNLNNSDADINQMAEACHVSRSVLQRRVKELMGVTPGDFLRMARIKHACQLLKDNTQTVAEVAYRCGFNDPKYFSRSFKHTMGISPSEYKAAQE